MKIYAVVTDQKESSIFLVKAHTRAGAEKFVTGKFKPKVMAKLPSQDELVTALKNGVEIEDATNSPQASLPEPAQTDDPPRE